MDANARSQFTEGGCPVMRGMGAPVSDEPIRQCPRCGGPVIYQGRGRRPVWCSTGCRNAAAVTRRGAREAAVEIRMIDVPKRPRRGPYEASPKQEDLAPGRPGKGARRAGPTASGRTSPGSAQPREASLGDHRALDRKSLTMAVLEDPGTVATVVMALCQLERAGKFSGEKWAGVRSGVVSLAELIRVEDEALSRSGLDPA